VFQKRPDSKSSGFSTYYAWLVVAMLFPVALLNYLDRMMVATMRTSIRADISTIANDADFGVLMAVFMWVYALLSPVGGYLADRFNRRWMIILSLFVWSAVTWLTGHARTFEQMGWARALMGVSEACYIPAALALIAEFHPGPTRSRAVGIHTGGIYAGQALGGVGGYIADTSSWRNAYYWFGLAGVLYAGVLLLFLRDAARTGETSGARASTVSIRATGKALFGAAGFGILIAYFTLPAMAGWAVKNWLPTHLAAAFGLSQGPAGL
jgi:MFS family permease